MKNILSTFAATLLAVGLSAVASETTGDLQRKNDEVDCQNGVALQHSLFTDSVIERVPNRRFIALGPAHEKVIFFTEVIGARGQRVEHRWFHDDVLVASVPFSIEGDRWRTWSSKKLGLIGPGELRVEVFDGSCTIAQESIQIGAEDQIDPATRSGWMWPSDALETLLAQAAAADPEIVPLRRGVDGFDKSGDPLLIAAIRRGDTVAALELIHAIPYGEIPDADALPLSDVERLGLAADPFRRGHDGVSAIELAFGTEQEEVLAALIASALNRHPKKRLKRSRFSANTGWRDFNIDSVSREDVGRKRFSDGDTPLIRAVRLGSERAVVTLLRIDEEEKEGEQLDDLRDMLFAYDASGRQPLDIARDNGRYGIEHFIRLALPKASPRWAVIRSAMTTRMDGDEPRDCRTRVLTDESEVHFFAEVADLKGRQIRHQWGLDGEVVQTNSFDVGAVLEKTHSQRRFSESDVGKWEVRTLDAQGTILVSETFHYVLASEREKKKRDAALRHSVCRAKSDALYSLIAAHAPVSKIKERLAHTDLIPLDLKKDRKLFQKVLEGGNISLTRWFLDSGFRIDGAVRHGKTPLMIAADRGDEAMALFLIAMGADLDVAERLKRRTAMIHAANNVDLEMIRILLRHGADPNLQDEDGFTALHKAVSRGCQLELSVLLLEHGADVSLKTQMGETARDQARACFERGAWPADMDSLQPLLE